MTRNDGNKPDNKIGAEATPSNSGKKPGKLDPCWCGSGQTYEDCHYATDMLLKALGMAQPT